MSSRLSRVLFRDDKGVEMYDHDLQSSDPYHLPKIMVTKTESEGDSDEHLDEVTTSPEVSDSGVVLSPDSHDSDPNNMTPKKQSMWSDGLEPSSPFNLVGTVKPSHCSSPSFLRNNIHELKLSESPKTPKTLFRKAEDEAAYSPQNTTRDSITPLVTKARGSILGRGVKRTYVTPKSANINPFTPSGMILQQTKAKRRKSSQFDG